MGRCHKTPTAVAFVVFSRNYGTKATAGGVDLNQAMTYLRQSDSIQFQRIKRGGAGVGLSGVGVREVELPLIAP